MESARAGLDAVQLGPDYSQEAVNGSDLEISIRDQLWMSMEALEKRTREAITRMSKSHTFTTVDGKLSTLVEEQKKIIIDNHKANLVTIDEVKQMLQYEIFMDQLSLHFKYVPPSVTECFIDELVLLRDDVRGRWKDIEDRNVKSEDAIKCIKSYVYRGYQTLEKLKEEEIKRETN